MIKITALVEFCPPRLGSDRRIYELLTRLRENHVVYFIVFPPSRALLGLIPFPSKHQKDNTASLEKNITAYYISIPRFLRTAWKNYFLGYLLTVLYIWPKVFLKIKKIDTDVIILNYPSAYTGLLGFLIGKILNKKVVADFNDMIAEYTISVLDDSTKHSDKTADVISKQMIRSLLTIIQNFIVRHADLVTALTTYTINYSKLLRIRDDIHLIPDGVDSTLFNPNKYSRQAIEELRSKYGIKEDEKVVLYIGRLEKWAGVQIVLKCAEMLKGSNIRFLLIGEGSLKVGDQLPNVILGGRIPHELVPKYLATADLVLVPMQQDVLGHSASPLKLFEAMAMEKAVIASDTRGIRDIMTHNVEGILLLQNEAMWSECIMNILNNPSSASELGKNARKRVETEFDWNMLANKLARLLLNNCLNAERKSRG